MLPQRRTERVGVAVAVWERPARNRRRTLAASMKTLDRYIFGSMLGPFAVVVAACVVGLVGHELWRYTDEIVQKQIPFDVVLRFVVFNVPKATLFALPAATVVAAAWALGRLIQDNELAAIRASGISRSRLLIPVACAGVCASLLCVVIGELVVPWANNASENLARNIVLGRRAFVLAQGRFLEASRDTYIYVLDAGLDGGASDEAGRRTARGYGVIAFQRAGNQPPWLITAPSASFDGKTLTLEQPSTYIADTDGLWVHARPANAASAMRIDVAEITRQYWSRRTGIQDMSLGELLAARRRVRQQALAPTRYDVQIHARFALPLSCLAIGFLVSAVTLRYAGAMYSAVLASVLVLFAYYFGMLWLHMAGSNGALPPALAVWSEDGICVAVGLLLLRG